MPPLSLPGLLKLRYLYRRFVARRHRGLHEQVLFWEHWFRTQGDAWPQEYIHRLDPQQVLAPELQACLEHLSDHDVHILDVGAGPLTVVGKQHPSKRLHITAVDVLAPHYDQILQRYHLSPPVRTVFADADKLVTFYPLNHFDLVYAQNSIDQTVDPLSVIKQMVYVVKANCFVFLDHQENKAEKEGYTGIHQWNFMVQGEAFMVRRGRSVVNVTHALAAMAEVTCTAQAGWLKVKIRKHAPTLTVS